MNIIELVASVLAARVLQGDLSESDAMMIMGDLGIKDEIHIGAYPAKKILIKELEKG